MQAAPPTPTPAERFATVFAWIMASVDRSLARNAAGLEGAVLLWLRGLIFRRLADVRKRFAHLAERLKAGWVYRPQPRAPRNPADPPKDRPPRKTNPLTTGSHWLFRAAPGHDTAAAAADLRNLLAEPEISALIAAAPEPAWRILRSLCQMLGVEKPPVLGPSKPPKPGKPLYHPPPPLPWEVVPYYPDATELYRKPSFFWPWIGPKPKIA